MRSLRACPAPVSGAGTTEGPQRGPAAARDSGRWSGPRGLREALASEEPPAPPELSWQRDRAAGAAAVHSAPLQPRRPLWVSGPASKGAGARQVPRWGRVCPCSRPTSAETPGWHFHGGHSRPCLDGTWPPGNTEVPPGGRVTRARPGGEPQGALGGVSSETRRRVGDAEGRQVFHAVSSALAPPPVWRGDPL